MEKGKYIVIEGGDGTGKTTQAQLLVDKLNKAHNKTLLVEEPGSTLIGSELRKIVKDGTLPRSPMTNLMLFTAGRIELWNQVIKPALEDGRHVVSARNWYSTLAYQGYGEGLDLNLIKNFTQDFVSEEYYRPDFPIILTHNSHAEIQQRMLRRVTDTEKDYFEESENLSKLTIDESYKKLAIDLGSFAINIDGMSINDVSEIIWNHISLTE